MIKAYEKIAKYNINIPTDEADISVLLCHDKGEATLVELPGKHRKGLSDITKVNSKSKSFDFLDGEPELYTVQDILYI